MRNTNFDDDKQWHVWLYEEVDILTNILRNFAMFRRHYGPYWPRKVVVHTENRITINFGEDIPIECEDWTLRNALYNWLYDPWYDPHKNTQQPRQFFGERTPIKDEEGKFYRFRRDKKNGS